MANKKQKVTIYWNTRHIKLEDIPEVKRRIRERFGIPNHTTVNGETDCYIREEDMELLRKRKNVASFKYVISPHENGVKMAKFLFA